jgi:hypothetical protein
MVNQYDQRLARNSTAARDDQQLRAYLGTLTPAERARYLQAQQQVRNGDDQEDDGADAPQAPQRAIRRPFNMQAYSGANPVQQGFIDQFGPAAQARHLGGMIKDVTGAIQDENDSRVAQSRELRRQEHEMAMEAMRQESLLERLAMEQRERQRDRILQRQLQTGVTTRRLVNGRWEDV